MLLAAIFAIIFHYQATVLYTITIYPSMTMALSQWLMVTEAK